MQKNILILSFLKFLRNRDPRAWRVIIFCITLQLLFTFVKLEATPFFLFGMFSEKMKSTDTVTTVRILVNDQPIESYKTSTRQQYLLETTIANYLEMKQNNGKDPVRTRIESRYPFIYRSAAYPLLSTHIYNEPADMEKFKTWFKTKCLEVAGSNSGTVTVMESTYLLQQSTSVPIRIKYEILETL